MKKKEFKSSAIEKLSKRILVLEKKHLIKEVVLSKLNQKLNQERHNVEINIPLQIEKIKKAMSTNTNYKLKISSNDMKNPSLEKSSEDKYFHRSRKNSLNKDVKEGDKSEINLNNSIISGNLGYDGKAITSRINNRKSSLINFNKENNTSMKSARKSLLENEANSQSNNNAVTNNSNLNNNANQFSIFNFANYNVVRDIQLNKNRLPKSMLGERKSLLKKGVKQLKNKTKNNSLLKNINNNSHNNTSHTINNTSKNSQNSSFNKTTSRENSQLNIGKDNCKRKISDSPLKSTLKKTKKPDFIISITNVDGNQNNANYLKEISDDFRMNNFLKSEKFLQYNLEDKSEIKNSTAFTKMFNNIRSNSMTNSSKSVPKIDPNCLFNTNSSNSKNNSNLKIKKLVIKDDIDPEKKKNNLNKFKNKSYTRALSTSPAFIATEEKTLKIVKEAIKSIKKPNKLALIMSTNKVVPINLRLKFAISCPIVTRFYKISYILEDMILFYTKNLAKIKKKLSAYSSNSEIMKQLESGFIPSKSVQVFINLITFDDEIAFKEDFSNKSSQILAKALLIMLNEKNILGSNNLQKINYLNILFKIMKNNQINRIKELLIYNLCGNIHVYPTTHIQLQNLLEMSSDTFGLTSELLKESNKVVKVLIYFVLDFMKYISNKCNDGTYIYTLRLMKLEENKIRWNLKKLRDSMY